MKPGERGLDAQRACQLLDHGYTYREAGVQLAYEAKRPIPYQARSVWHAVRRADRSA